MLSHVYLWFIVVAPRPLKFQSRSWQLHFKSIPGFELSQPLTEYGRVQRQYIPGRCRTPLTSDFALMTPQQRRGTFLRTTMQSRRLLSHLPFCSLSLPHLESDLHHCLILTASFFLLTGIALRNFLHIYIILASPSQRTWANTGIT